jgi:LacI family transcriptional regulator
MHKLGYVHNLVAARLRADKTRIVGLIIPNVRNPFFAELLTGVEEVMDDAGLAVLLANSRDDAVRQVDLLRRMREHGVDGILLCPAADTQVETLKKAEELRVPLVQVLRHVSRDADYVGPNYSAGMYNAVDYLVSLGHRHIAFAAHGLMHSAYRERVQGFEKAIASHEARTGKVVHFPLSLSDIAKATDLLLEGPDRPTATICFNDVVAFGLLSGFYDRNIRVAADHSIIGFDDVMDAEAIRPRITAVATRPVEIGRRAAHHLLKRLQDRSRPVEWIITETSLVVRESCGQFSAPNGTS